MIDLDAFLTVVPNDRELNNIVDGVEESVQDVVNRIFAEVMPPDWQNSNELALTGSLGNEFDRQVFTTIISTRGITSLTLLRNSDANSVFEMLLIAAPLIQRLETIVADVELTQVEADCILSILHSFTSLYTIGVCLGTCTGGMAISLKKFLKESLSTRYLVLECPREGFSHSPQDTVSTIYDAAVESTSLERLCVHRVQPGNYSDMLARLTASVLDKAASLTYIQSFDYDKAFSLRSSVASFAQRPCTT